MRLLRILVAVVAMGMLSSVTVALRHCALPPPDIVTLRISNARSASHASGKPIAIRIRSSDGLRSVRVLPNGTILVDSNAVRFSTTGRRSGRVQIPWAR